MTDEGSVVREPTMSIVGEHGPELILPLNDPERMAELLSEVASVRIHFHRPGRMWSVEDLRQHLAEEHNDPARDLSYDELVERHDDHPHGFGSLAEG